MERISISFYPETYKKLSEQADEKNFSLSAYVRHLVDIGLRVEAASKNSDDEEEQKSEIEGLKESLDEGLSELKMLWKNGLSWSLESRLLVRYLVENLEEKPDKSHQEVLLAFKEKANSYVTGMLKESVD